jgi:hypothetical protein
LETASARTPVPTANPKRLTATANQPTLAPMSDLCRLIWCALIGLFRVAGCVGSRDPCPSTPTQRAAAQIPEGRLLAFVAYALALATYVVTAWRVARNRDLLKRSVECFGDRSSFVRHLNVGASLEQFAFASGKSGGRVGTTGLGYMTRTLIMTASPHSTSTVLPSPISLAPP